MSKFSSVVMREFSGVVMSGVMMSSVVMREFNGVVMSGVVMREFSGVVMREFSGVVLGCFTLSRSTVLTTVLCIKPEDSFSSLLKAVL